VNGAQTETSVREPLAVLRSGLPIVLLTTVLIAGLALANSLRQDPLYQSSANVFIATNSVNSITGTVSLLSTDPQRVLATQAQVAALPEVARSAAEASPVKVSPEAIAGMTQIEPAGDADSLTFTVTASSPKRAQVFADAYARGYVNYREARQVEAQEDLQARIEELREQTDATGEEMAALLRESGGLESGQTGGTSTLGQPASLGGKIQPHPAQDTVLGSVLGLILGIALVFIRDAMNTKMRTAEEVEGRLGIPLLGRIPPLARRSKGYELDVLANPGSMQSEAYRLLATNIELVNLDRGARSIVVTSSLHSEGKSLTTASLGVCFAGRGYRVAIIEADVRRPVLAQIFGIESGAGLADVALGTADLEDALVTIPLSGDEPSARWESALEYGTNGVGPESGELQVLLSGPVPPSPSEFLKSQAVATIISDLSERFDLVLIDTPPILHLSDVPTLMATAPIDCVIASVRLRRIKRRTVDELRRTLESVPVVKLGFFTTGEQGATPSGYGYGYGYGYGRPTPGVKDRRFSRRPKALADGHNS